MKTLTILFFADTVDVVQLIPKKLLAAADKIALTFDDDYVLVIKNKLDDEKSGFHNE